jgi:2-iminoacetate synthase
MSANAMFSEILPTLPLDHWEGLSRSASPAAVSAILRRGQVRTLDEFALLLSPAAEPFLEEIAQLSQGRTRHHFGKTIRFFAPLYLSNECVNTCKYCGFSRENEIPRITIPLDQVEAETIKLAQQGFRSLLLVAGEHPKYVSNGYVRAAVQRCLKWMPSIALELGPLETPDYLPLVEAGCESLIVYQETYDEPTYRQMHTFGPKKKYGWRMDTAERAYAAGFRRLGIGALFGLADWRREALALAAHALHLTRRCWKAQLTLSFPRLRPAAGGFETNPDFYLPDRSFIQLLGALRLLLPHAGFVLSTRESPSFRDQAFSLGFTHMSAGSCTEPGGYSSYQEDNWRRTQDQPGEQFEIADERAPKEVAAMVAARGYEPVWKDFDSALVQDLSPFLKARSA